MINKKLTWKHYVGWFKYGISFVLIMLVKPIYKYVQSGIAASFFQTLTVYYNGYMSMFFGIYILIPFLNTLWAQLKGHQKATLLFVLLFLCIVPSATGIAITSYWSPLCPFLYYYTGAILREYKVNLKNSTIAASVVGVCLLGTVYAIFFSEDILNMGFFWKVYNNYCNTYYTLPTYFLTVLIIIYFLNKTSYSPVVLKVLEKLAIHSLGIYLISSLYTQTTVWNVAGRYVELTDTTVLLIAPIVIVLEIVITYILSVVVERVSSLAYRKLMDRVAVKIGN